MEIKQTRWEKDMSVFDKWASEMGTAVIDGASTLYTR